MMSRTVVIGGVGPALGELLARWFATEGDHVVLWVLVVSPIVPLYPTARENSICGDTGQPSTDNPKLEGSLNKL